MFSLSFTVFPGRKALLDAEESGREGENCSNVQSSISHRQPRWSATPCPAKILCKCKSPAQPARPSVNSCTMIGGIFFIRPFLPRCHPNSTKNEEIGHSPFGENIGSGSFLACCVLFLLKMDLENRCRSMTGWGRPSV